MDVVILAGGIGRRFGGAKQFTPVAPDGATLLEATLRDARRAGCRRGVVVTAPGGEASALELFAARPIDGMEVTAVPQRPDDLPLDPGVDRDRPWGTAHALWAARDAVDGPFLLFNADDHYGPGAPAALMTALPDDADAPTFALLGYPLGATLSRSGTVSRALCRVVDGCLKGMREHPAVDPQGRSGDEALPLDAPVSMNAWAFTPDVFPLLEEALRTFLADPEGECYLPTAVDDAVKTGRVIVRVADAPDPWCGLTWPEDRRRVARRLASGGVTDPVAAAFGIRATTNPKPFGDGLIHDTWRLATDDGPHLVQRLNDVVFPDPAAVAANAAAAARRVDHALRHRGDDDPRHRLVFRTTPAGASSWTDAAGGTWRVMRFIPDSRPADLTVPSELCDAARLLGAFPGLVAEGEGPNPVEVLPGFHDTPARLAAFRGAVARDTAGRLAGCRPEVDRLEALSHLAHRLAKADLPVRPVHNDAKPDNVLVDASTGAPLCVVDLDTVMPGLAPLDFGDLVRSSVTGKPEDEADLDTITVRMDVFRDLAEGYLEGAADWITDAERDHLMDGALVITWEQAARFLADHLDGDPYYPVDDAGHNLRRTRAQLRLLEALLESEQELRRLVR